MDSDHIMYDPRPIKRLWFFNSHGDSSVTAGEGGVGEIKPYEENGQMAPVTWYKIFDSAGNLKQRMNGAFVATVDYYTY